MIGRIEFETNKFKIPRTNRKIKNIKTSYKKIYGWLSRGLRDANIVHKVIDLDAESNNGIQTKKRNRQYGLTILVLMSKRYQIICGWFPECGDLDKGKWGIEIYKERSFIDRLLLRNRLGHRDRLVKSIMTILDTEDFKEVHYKTIK